MTSNSYLRLGTAFWALTALLAIAPSWPYIYYRLSPGTSDSLANTIGDTVTPPSSLRGGTQTQQSIQITPTLTPLEVPLVKGESPASGGEGGSNLPQLDPTLPKQNGLIIDKIGVRGEIHEGDDWQSILKKGIWRVPSFGTPTTIYDLPNYPTTQPIIIAAHRWGYLDWSNSFRKLNSFYNLPKLAVGDTIKITWEQREYEYKVYSVKTGTSIPEYNADLILYTCQLWNSPVRFFVLANRIP